MIKVLDKVYTNAHPVDRIEPERVELAKQEIPIPIDLNDFKKFKKIYESGGNLRKAGFGKAKTDTLMRYYNILKKKR